MGRRLGILIGAVLLAAAFWYAYPEAPAETAPSTKTRPRPEETTARGDGETPEARGGFSLWGLLSGSEAGQGQSQGGWRVWPPRGWGSRW